ncbi:MAG: hypothetical protein J7L96_09985, partial [Bacteroidales bacterium]|nr:hypothetical protein [Bacteroidales bacterium]
MIRIVFSILVSLLLFPLPANTQELVDLVNPRIGNISHLLMPTFPTGHRPYGMIRFWPETNPGITDPYLATRIYGFPLNRPVHRGNPAITVMPMMGKESLKNSDFSAEFDKDFEMITPYYYSVQLDELEMKVEFAPTERCADFVFTPSKSDELVLLFKTGDQSKFQLKSNHNLIAYETVNGVKQHANIFFNHPVIESGYINDSGQLIKSKKLTGRGLKFYIIFDGSVQVIMNYAISWIDAK